MSSTPEDFLHDVWSYQPIGYGFLCVRHTNTSWETRAVTDTDELLVPEDVGDVYFTPNTFREPRRVRELMLPSRWLYADLDAVDPREFEERLHPTVAWETSPNRFQALWLTQSLRPESHQKLN